MSLHSRPAKRSSSKPLIGFYSKSRGGKTRAALWLARGFVGPKGRIEMIESESGRGEVYAEELPGGYNVIPIRPSDGFSPRTYSEAIDIAEANKADALIIDSSSHEWEGVGGVLDMAAKNQEAGKKGLLVWQVPKIEHQKYFINRLLQTPIPLVIVCMRAKYPMEERRVDGKKEMVRSTELEPTQSDGILYELMIFGWFDTEKHHFHAGGAPLVPALSGIIRDNETVGIETGEALANWARGETRSVAERIAAAKDQNELNALWHTLSKEDGDAALDAFKARKAELSKAGQG